MELSTPHGRAGNTDEHGRRRQPFGTFGPSKPTAEVWSARRTVAGRPVCGEIALEGPRILGARDGDAGAGHRREYRGVQRASRRGAPAAPLSGRGRTGARLHLVSQRSELPAGT